MARISEYLGLNAALEWAKRKPDYPSPPQMYVRMRREFYPFWWAYLIFTVIRMMITMGSDGASPTWRYTSYVTMAILVLYILHCWNCKRRWLRLQARVRTEDYLYCPSCAHDLKGCPLKGETRVVSTPARSEPIDVVLCPECGDGYKVRELEGFWELPLPKWFEIGRHLSLRGVVGNAFLRRLVAVEMRLMRKWRATWRALFVSALLLALWIVSSIGVKYNLLSYQGVDLDLSRGKVWISHYNNDWKPSHPGDLFNAVPNDVTSVGPLTIWSSARGHWGVDLRMWFPFAVAVCITGYVWGRDLRARRVATKGLCRKCNYDLTGISVGGTCPECGTTK